MIQVKKEDLMIEAICRMVTEMKQPKPTVQLLRLDSSQAPLSHNHLFYPQPQKTNSLLQGQQEGVP
jgi:hypothetical protein